MIHLIDCGKYEFSKRILGKKLFCFGAGKKLETFMEKTPNVQLTGVIDNYKWMDSPKIEVRGACVDVISIEQFVQKYDDSCAVVITCQMYEEIIDQMDQIPELDGMDCYIDFFLEQFTEHFEELPISGRKENIIPKKIHYCWFGGKELPDEYKKYIESWKKYCPDYEIIRWDESNYDITKNQYMRQAYENKKWVVVSDYARVDIIYHYGGVYLDTDVELIKNFDELLKWDMFCGFENTTHINLGIGYGAVKGHKILKDILDEYENMSFINDDGSLNLTGCAVVQSKIMKQHGFLVNGQPQAQENVVAYPCEFFAPLSYIEGFGRITANTHSIYHYSVSWLDDNSQSRFNRWKPLVEKVKRYNEEQKMDRNFCTMNKTAPIKRYQIWDDISESNTAGSKAPNDIKNIAGQFGYQVINIHPLRGTPDSATRIWSTRQNISDWDKCYELIPENAILLLQHPFWQEQEARELTIRRLKQEKNVRVISLVHDVEKLRGIFENEYMNHEFEFMLHNADILIVHNKIMADFFVNQGIAKERIISLEIFDYLTESNNIKNTFEKSLVIAGNLDSKKSGYIEKLKLLTDIKIHLFGPNYKADSSIECIEYHGSFSGEQIVNALQGGFGLVWDGDSLKTCAGLSGRYLRYNNPHKLSLYLVAGIPVIIWNEAAEASFVKEYGVGLVISSIYELPEILQKMTEETYNQYLNNVSIIASQLRQGEYMKKSLKKAEQLLLKSF